MSKKSDIYSWASSQKDGFFFPSPPPGIDPIVHSVLRGLYFISGEQRPVKMYVGHIMNRNDIPAYCGDAIRLITSERLSTSNYDIFTPVCRLNFERFRISFVASLRPSEDFDSLTLEVRKSPDDETLKLF